MSVPQQIILVEGVTSGNDTMSTFLWVTLWCMISITGVVLCYFTVVKIAPIVGRMRNNAFLDEENVREK